MKKSISKGFLLILFSSTYFACTNGIENLVDAGVPIVDSSPALVADVKASSNLLGWGNIGDTTIAVKADISILPAIPIIKPDLKTITINTEGSFRLLSVGGSLSAGFKDGGLYREGQLTSFPNLIARQIGVTFYQPLFDATNGNGSGYKVLTSTEPIASFKLVKNNLGYLDNAKADKFKKFNGSNNDQYAFPEITKRLDLTAFTQKYVDRIVSTSATGNYKTPLEWVGNETADFVIFELGMDDMVRSVLVGGGGGLNSVFGGSAYFSTEFGLMKKMADKKTKGVILNVPDVLDFPYFNQFTEEKIKKSGRTFYVQESASSTHYRPFDFAIDRIVPTAKTEKIFTGLLRDVTDLSDSDVLSAYDGDNEVFAIANTSYNVNEIKPRAKELDWAVVDIYSVYKKILSGIYTTDDGVKVNPD